jgi:hypothetical protein
MQKSLCAIVAIAAISLGCGAAMAAEPIITTVAGGGTYDGDRGDGGLATDAVVSPSDVAVDAAGNLYIADRACAIRKVSTSGIITTIAGNGVSGTPAPGNGALATSGSICSPTVAVDAFGYVYFFSGYRIGKVDPTGIVTIVAGTGFSGYTGEGGPATSAKLGYVDDIAIDAAGALYITDTNRVRKIGTNGIITTIAGTGVSGEAGDNGPALLASMVPMDLTVDRLGNVYIVDNSRDSVRKISPAGVITRIWGGWPQFRSDPMAVFTDAYYPSGLVTDPAGNLYVSNTQNFVSLISPDNAIKHIVGIYNDTTFDTPNGYGAPRGFEGDGGPALLAKMHEPDGIALDAQGNLYIADKENNRVRKVTGPFQPATAPAGAFAFTHAGPHLLVSPNQYSVGIVKGDSNGDNLSDLFVLADNWLEVEPHPGDWELHVYRQNPDGTLASPISFPVPHINLTDVMAVDLNHDRYIDIVFSGYDYSKVTEGVFVMLGSASGMAPPVKYNGINGANGAFYLDQADMNGDGHMDVLAYLSTGGSGVGTFSNWAVYYGNGTGTFVRKKLTPLTRGTANLVRDFNGDGHPDMLWGWFTETDSGVAVAYHDGVDSFLPPTEYPGTGVPDRTGAFPVFGDFDSDGRGDLIFAIDGNAPHSKLNHWTRSASGGFSFVRSWLTYDNSDALIAGDMNNDGRDDLMVRHTGWSSIGYLQQARKSDGSYWLDREVKAYARIGNTTLPHSMVVGYFNRDECPDIAFVSTNSGLQIQYGVRCRKVKHGAKPPVPPKRSTLPAATLVATQSSEATTTNVAYRIWAASQKLARDTFASTIGASRPTVRWVAASLSVMFGAWGMLVAWRLLRR